MKPSCRACLLSGVSSQDSRICNGCIQDYWVQAEQPGSKGGGGNKKKNMTWSTTLLFLHLTASKCVSPEEFRLFFSVRAESMLQLLASKTCQNTSWQDSFYQHHYSWVIKVPHGVLCNTSGHMDLNKKCSQCSLCECEPDKVRQMITVTQNMARWSAHPSVTRTPLKHPPHTHMH